MKQIQQLHSKTFGRQLWIVFCEYNCNYPKRKSAIMAMTSMSRFMPLYAPKPTRSQQPRVSAPCTTLASSSFWIDYGPCTINNTPPDFCLISPKLMTQTFIRWNDITDAQTKGGSKKEQLFTLPGVKAKAMQMKTNGCNNKQRLLY